jgi:hypothetical protein
LHQADAIRIIARLKAAFPATDLDEAQAELLLREVALLHDPSILNEAVDQIIRTEEKFPPIARIRAAYRTVNEARGREQRALEAAQERPYADGEIPEWVHVWDWHRRRTLTARQAAKEMACPVDDRPPVPARDFPQMRARHDQEGAYTQAEYEQLRQAWIAAGRPEFGRDFLLAARMAA